MTPLEICGYIRNDLLHNNGIASAEQARKCVVLKWFRPDERMVLGTRHVLDCLNQTGVLSLHLAYNGAGHSCVLSVLPDRDALLQWRPEPKLVSVRTHGADNPETDLVKAVTVVFDNGLFSSNIPFRMDDSRRRAALGDATIRSDGSALVFADGTTVASRRIYEAAVAGNAIAGRGNHGFLLPGRRSEFRR